MIVLGRIVRVDMWVRGSESLIGAVGGEGLPPLLPGWPHFSRLGGRAWEQPPKKRSRHKAIIERSPLLQSCCFSKQTD